jgi:predicted metalloprotease
MKSAIMCKLLGITDKVEGDRAGRGRVVPNSFTHGASAQRAHWFKRGYDGGEISQCDTFAARSL